MQSIKKALTAAVVLVFALSVLPPAAALAADTWDAVLEAYPDHELNDFVMELQATDDQTWNAVVSQLGGESQVTVRIYGSDGSLINGGGNAIPIATGQHVSVTLVDDPRGVNLLQVIILGDVLGTGRLNISQLTRFAAALNGSRPLVGLYAQAADLNGSGRVDIGDLVKMSAWLRKKEL